MRRRLPSILVIVFPVIVYIVVGLIVAQQHHYFNNLGTFKRVASSVFAVLLWWLVLLGVNVQFKFTLVDL
ncbi:MAG: hypothetical protein ABSB96_03235 [Gaiellaceae bacterium]